MISFAKINLSYFIYFIFLTRHHAMTYTRIKNDNPFLLKGKTFLVHCNHETYIRQLLRNDKSSKSYENFMFIQSYFCCMYYPYTVTHVTQYIFIIKIGVNVTTFAEGTLWACNKGALQIRTQWLCLEVRCRTIWEVLELYRTHLEGISLMGVYYMIPKSILLIRPG